jgi:hypothetical protein
MQLEEDVTEKVSQATCLEEQIFIFLSHGQEGVQ